VIPKIALELRPESLSLLPPAMAEASVAVAELDSEIVSEARRLSVSDAEAVDVAKVDEASEVVDLVFVDDSDEDVLVELALVLVVAVEDSAERIFWDSPTISTALSHEFSFISKNARGSSLLPPTNTTLPLASWATEYCPCARDIAGASVELYSGQSFKERARLAF